MRRITAFIFVASCSKDCASSNHAPIAAEHSREASAVAIDAAIDANDDASTDASSIVSDALASDDGCVDVEANVRHFYTYWQQRESSAPDDFDAAVGQGMYVSRSTTEDLDGDGIKEIVWGFSTPPIESTQFIFRGGACSVFLGELEPGVIKVETHKHGGYKDLTVEDYGSFCEGAQCGCSPEIRHYAISMDTTYYTEDRKRRTAGHFNACTD